MGSWETLDSKVRALAAAVKTWESGNYQKLGDVPAWVLSSLEKDALGVIAPVEVCRQDEQLAAKKSAHDKVIKAYRTPNMEEAKTAVRDALKGLEETAEGFTTIASEIVDNLDQFCLPEEWTTELDLGAAGYCEMEVYLGDLDYDGHLSESRDKAADLDDDPVKEAVGELRRILAPLFGWEEADNTGWEARECRVNARRSDYSSPRDGLRALVDSPASFYDCGDYDTERRVVLAPAVDRHTQGRFYEIRPTAAGDNSEPRYVVYLPGYAAAPLEIPRSLVLGDPVFWPSNWEELRARCRPIPWAA